MANGDLLPGTVDDTAPDFNLLGKSIAGAFSQLSDFTFLKVVPSNLIAEGLAFFLAWPLKIIADIVVLAAKVLTDLLATQGAETSALASVALSEVFGTEVNVATGRGGVGPEAAGALGASILARLLPQLAGGAQTVGPTAQPAEQFMGELLGVSIRAWLLEFVTDLMPESVRIAPFNDLIEAVLGSTGISRLARVALRPAIQHAIATPLEWLVLDALRPTLVSEAQAVTAFNRGKWTAQQLDDELGAKGYNADRQEIIINDALKRLSIGDIRTLVKNQVWTDEQAITDLEEQGYPNGNAAAALAVAHLEEIDALRPRAIAAFELQWKRGKIDDGGFTSALGALDIRPEVAQFWVNILHAEKVAGFKVLDVTQLKAALAANVISLPEWRDGLTLLGYADDDVTIIEMTEQAVFATKEAAAAAKAAQKQQAAADKAAKAAAAAQAKKDKAAAAAAAKQQAAIDKAAAQAKKQADLLAKQKLLADQAQARRDQVAAAKAAQKITDAQAAQELATVTAQEQAAAAAVATHNATQTALDQAANASDQAQLIATTAADAASRDAANALALADAQAAALEERRSERIALYQAQKDKNDQELADGLITQSAHDKAIATITVNENAAIKAERLDQLAIARAQKQANARIAGAQAAAAKASARATLIPTATTRRTATIAATAAAKAQVAASSLQVRTGTKAAIASQKAAATVQATQAIDTLNAQLLEQLQAFEAAHGPTPPKP